MAAPPRPAARPAVRSAARPIHTGSGAPPPDGRDLERALGRAIRAARRRLDLSVSDLAAAAGLSVGMMSKIETGALSPSLASLQAVAGALGVPLSSLFAASDERRDCSFVKAGTGVVIERRGTKAGHLYELLGHGLGGDVVVEPYLIRLETAATPTTSFQHGGVELIHMLSGRVTYRHGDRSYELAPGDTLLFDSAAAHGPETLTELPSTYLSVIVYPRPTG